MFIWQLAEGDRTYASDDGVFQFTPRFENTVKGLSPAPASASNGPAPQYYAQPAPGGNPNISYGVDNAPPQGAPMDDPSNGRPW